VNDGMTVNFCTIASGSSGNSAFFAAGRTKILIDAGLSGRAIEQALAMRGANPRELSAIFVTHEHSDHIQGAGVLSRRYDVPLYMTAGTWGYVSHYKALGKLAEKNRVTALPGVPVVLADMAVTPFSVPHDANDPVGYVVECGGRKIAIATDFGHASPETAGHFFGADVIIIESNHDLNMLNNGPYPAHLKRRILSNTGHLSNVACGRLLADIYSPKTRHIFLAHLSADNNHPALAFQTVHDIMTAGGINVGGDVGLYVAERHRPSVMMEI